MQGKRKMHTLPIFYTDYRNSPTSILHE